MTNYEFILEYIRVMCLAMEHGFTVPADKQKVLEYKNEITARAQKPEWHDDGLDKACTRLMRDLSVTNHRYTDYIAQDLNILKYLGIQDMPAKVLYDQVDQAEPYNTVTAFFIDYNSPEDDTGHAYNGGNGCEISVCADTRAEAYKELRKLYDGCWWREVVDVSEVTHVPARTMYYYRGYIYTI